MPSPCEYQPTNKKSKSEDLLFWYLVDHTGFADLGEVVAGLLPDALAGLMVDPSQTEAQAVTVQLLIGVRIVPVHVALQVHTAL